MIKTNTILMSLGIVIILIASAINTTSQTTQTTTPPISNPLVVDPYPQLDAVKKVKYGSSGWVDEISVPVGTTVRFNISVFESIFVASCIKSFSEKKIDINDIDFSKVELLKNNEQFIDATQSGTASEKNVTFRISLAKQMLE